VRVYYAYLSFGAHNVAHKLRCNVCRRIV